jgi:hypothetical protein
MHSATWDNSYDLSGKTVAILGGGSSAVQIIPNIQPGKPAEVVTKAQRNSSLTFWSIVVGKLIPFLRSSVWVTTGFAAKYAGLGGSNFNCKTQRQPEDRILTQADSPEQIEGFKKDPEAYNKYCRELEGELSKRFTLVCRQLSLVCCWKTTNSYLSDAYEEQRPKAIPRLSGGTHGRTIRS